MVDFERDGHRRDAQWIVWDDNSEMGIDIDNLSNEYIDGLIHTLMDVFVKLD